MAQGKVFADDEQVSFQRRLPLKRFLAPDKPGENVDHQFFGVVHIPTMRFM